MTVPTVVLEVVDGPAAGKVFRYNGNDTFVLGRSDSAQLRLADDSHLSRNHFRIEINPPRCHVQDLESANGTFVNGERIAERWLENGDTISGGQTRIRIRIEEIHDDPLALTLVPDSPGLMSETAVMQPPPSRCGQYRLEEQVGLGSMGIVFRATHLQSGVRAAVKLVAPNMSRNDVVLKSFVREASVLRLLEHKRIVRFIDTGVECGHLYLVMEYVDAIDLPEVLRKMSQSGRIRIACGLMRQVLDGLSYAHDKGLVHRDIKPKNVLVSQQDNGLKAKLADFGLAKNFLEAGLSRFSCENEIKGTLNYMAPEQVANSRYATPQSDLFSVGATLYTLITNQPLYDDRDRSAPIATILQDGPIPIEKRLPNVPADLKSLLRCALAFEPANRFRNADDMRQALSGLAGL